MGRGLSELQKTILLVGKRRREGHDPAHPAYGCDVCRADVLIQVPLVRAAITPRMRRRRASDRSNSTVKPPSCVSRNTVAAISNGLASGKSANSSKSLVLGAGWWLGSSIRAPADEISRISPRPDCSSKRKRTARVTECRLEALFPWVLATPLAFCERCHDAFRQGSGECHKALPRAIYNAVQSSLSRAMRRLATRGLVRPTAWGADLTEDGLQVARMFGGRGR